MISHDDVGSPRMRMTRPEDESTNSSFKWKPRFVLCDTIIAKIFKFKMDLSSSSDTPVKDLKGKVVL